MPTTVMALGVMTALPLPFEDDETRVSHPPSRRGARAWMTAGQVVGPGVLTSMKR